MFSSISFVRIGLFDACHVPHSMGSQEGEAGEHVQKEMSKGMDYQLWILEEEPKWLEGELLRKMWGHMFQNTGFQPGGDSVPKGHWAMSGDIFGCHNWGPGGVAIGAWWGEVKDSAQHPIMHRPAPRANIQLQMSVLPN